MKEEGGGEQKKGVRSHFIALHTHIACCYYYKNKHYSEGSWNIGGNSVALSPIITLYTMVRTNDATTWESRFQESKGH